MRGHKQAIESVSQNYQLYVHVKYMLQVWSLVRSEDLRYASGACQRQALGSRYQNSGSLHHEQAFSRTSQDIDS